MSIVQLPDMFVEERTPSAAGGVAPPRHTYEQHPEVNAKELDDTDCLNGRAKLRRGWDIRALEILVEYTPQIPDLKPEEIAPAVFDVTGFTSWKQSAEFVKDDECVHFYLMLKYFCTKKGIKPRENLDFIDGTGVGFYRQYLDICKQTLENAFDAKWFYQMKRPLVTLLEQGVDMSYDANAIHPGHWSYPAGHGTKFLTAARVIAKQFDVPEAEMRVILIAACILSHGRSGLFIHYPSDNLASWDMVESVVEAAFTN
jgi:hypothetical protein